MQTAPNTTTERTGSRPLVAAAFTSILLYGFCLPLVSTHLPRLQEAFDLTIARSGLIAGGMAGGFVLATVGGGWLADAAGLTRLVGVGLVLMTAGLGLLANADGFGMALAGTLVFGVGAGFTEAFGTALISEVGGERRRALLNLSQVFFGIGAFTSPTVGGALAANLAGGWRLSVLLPVPFAAALALFFLLRPVVRPHEDEAIHWGALARLVRHPAFVWLTLAMFLYVGGEQGISQWLPMFAARTRNFPVAWGQWALAAFWAAVALGRLLVAFVPLHVDDLKLVRLGGLASAAAALLLIVLPWRGTLLVFAATVGFANAGLWPTIMAATGARFRELPGTAFGVVAGAGALGWLVLQPAVGYVARLPVFESESQGLAFGLLLPMLCFVLLAACIARVGKTSS